tara:strand:- start:282 stop:569 length:288 start_codon:yes stop_codon:yes gene_type:complete
VGVTTKKNIIPITIGETIFPNNNPNLNQSLFNGVSIFELTNPNIKKIMEIVKKDNLIFSPLINGHNEITKKNIKKTIPKLLFELIFICFFSINKN